MTNTEMNMFESIAANHYNRLKNLEKENTEDCNNESNLHIQRIYRMSATDYANTAEALLMGFRIGEGCVRTEEEIINHWKEIAK